MLIENVRTLNVENKCHKNVEDDFRKMHLENPTLSTKYVKSLK